MKIVFAGTPSFAVRPLEKILEIGYEVVGVVAQPDKPQGRKGVLTSPPVKRFAEERGIPVIQPVKLRGEVAALRALHGDVMITCAYGQILTEEVLASFPLGVWNIHASLLPAYRGASPIQSCVLAGETETGVTVMKTEKGLDTGDMLLALKTPIGETETYGELSERLSSLGAEAIAQALPMIESGKYTLKKQDSAAAFCVGKISKENSVMDFSLSPKRLTDFVRGMNPEPAAYAEIDGFRFNVYRVEPALRPEGTENAEPGEVLTDSPKRGFTVACGEGGAVKLTEVQPAGGKRMKGSDFLNGGKVKKGQRFSC